MQINKILRYSLIGGIFLIPFIPLIVSSQMFFPFITGKNFSFRILVEIIFGVWLLLALRDTSYRPRFTWLTVSVIAFVGIIAVADIFGENAFKSFWSNFERMEGLVALIHLAMYFFAAAAVLNTEKLWSYFFNTTVGVSVFLGGYGLLQLAGKLTINQGGVRLDATLGNATYLAIYMLFHAFITAILLVRWRGPKWVTYLYGLIILLQVFILYHTATRGAILGFIGGTILTALLIVLFERKHVLLRKIGIGIFAGMILLVGGFFVVKDAEFIGESETLSRLASISLEEESNTRFIIWNMAWQGVKEHPILGWGQDNFNYVFNKYYDPRLYAQEPWFDRVHDIVLDWLIAGGFLGLLAYLAMPLLALYYLWWGSREFSIIEKSLFTGMLAGYGFHNLFVFDNLISYILFFTILGYIHFSNQKDFPESISKRFTFSEGMRERVLVPIVIILILAGLYFFNAKGILASRAVIDALSPQQENLEINLAFFEKAIAYRSLGRQESVEQLVQSASQLQSTDLDLEIKTKFFESAKTAIEALIEDHPGDARLVLFYATFLNRYAFYDEAIVQLEKARELSPQKQSIHFELGSSYLNQGDAEKAFEVFEEAYLLETNYVDAKFIYATGAIYAGRVEIADEIIDAMFKEFDETGSGLRVDDRMLRAYTNTGRFDKVIALLEGAVERMPDNSQYYLSLGATYLQVGEREKSIIALQKVIELDPSFKEQGEYFIQEIRAGRNP